MEKKNFKIINLADVNATKVEWLWYPYIPLGKITIIQGDAGEGKTTFILRLASMMSRGEFFNENGEIEKKEPISIIYQTAEDGLSDTIKPRLLEAEADCSKILVIDESDKPLSMLDDRIERAIKETNAKILILDPIQAYLGSKVDMNRANDVRAVTKHLGMIAENTGCAVIFIGHMNKASGAKAAYRGIGSVDIFAVARSVLLIGKLPKDKYTRIVCPIKNNLAMMGRSISFRLDETGFKWNGFCDITEDELLTGIAGDKKCDKASQYILDILEEYETYPVNNIYEHLKAIGISQRTAESAKKVINAKSIKIGTEWHWKL